MSDASANNLLLVQGGGPTAVMNRSLVGVITAAPEDRRIGALLGARFGMKGLLQSEFIDLRAQPDAAIDGLRHTPGAALGSSRQSLAPGDDERILAVLRAHGVRYLMCQGGNGTMTMARRVQRAAIEAGHPLHVIGVPKTIDNDLPETDRCPGFGSAARFVAQSVRDVGMDVRALPTPVSIFETMGRSAGWLTAASVLARDGADDAPHLVYVAERAFDAERFVNDVDEVLRRRGWVVACVTEGLVDASGEPVSMAHGSTQRDAFGRALPGDVGSYLAGLVQQRLGVAARSEKPGLCGRSSIAHVSSTDQKDAEAVGHAAVSAALNGQRGEMITLMPRQSAEEPARTGLVSLDLVADAERTLPTEWINEAGNDMTPAFARYAQPLIGGELMRYARLQTRAASIQPDGAQAQRVADDRERAEGHGGGGDDR